VLQFFRCGVGEAAPQLHSGVILLYLYLRTFFPERVFYKSYDDVMPVPYQ
jgi:hypothetical protein